MKKKLKTVIENYKKEIASDELLMKNEKTELYKACYLVKISAIYGILSELEYILNEVSVRKEKFCFNRKCNHYPKPNICNLYDKCTKSKTCVEIES